MAEGEGFQIVIWDVINKKKQEKDKKGEYVNSGQVILKTVKVEQVNLDWGFFFFVFYSFVV